MLEQVIDLTEEGATPYIVNDGGNRVKEVIEFYDIDISILRPYDQVIDIADKARGLYGESTYEELEDKVLKQESREEELLNHIEMLNQKIERLTGVKTYIATKGLEIR